MTKSLTILTTVAMIALGSTAYAIDHDGGPEGRKGPDWQGLSKAEKLQRIEKRRSEYRQELDAKWNSMSDDEKLKHVEEKMGKHRGRLRERRDDFQEHRQERIEKRRSGE